MTKKCPVAGAHVVQFCTARVFRRMKKIHSYKQGLTVICPRAEVSPREYQRQMWWPVQLVLHCHGWDGIHEYLKYFLTVIFWKLHNSQTTVDLWADNLDVRGVYFPGKRRESHVQGWSRPLLGKTGWLAGYLLMKDLQLFGILVKTRGSVAFRIRLRSKRCHPHTEYPTCCVDFALDLQPIKVAEPAVYTVYTRTNYPSTGPYNSRDVGFSSYEATRENEQQCVSVCACTWWGTGVLKWLPAGAFIINNDSRLLLSSFSILWTMLNCGPKPDASNLHAFLPFHLQEQEKKTSLCQPHSQISSRQLWDVNTCFGISYTAFQMWHWGLQYMKV